MPNPSTTLWERLFSWLRRPSVPVITPPTPVVPPVPINSPQSGSVSAPPVTPAPSPQPIPPVPPVVPPVAPVPPPVIPSPPIVPLEVVTLPMEGPNLDFRKLWRNHPTSGEGEVFPCRDVHDMPNFDNQCAILMGTCLLRSDLLRGYDKATCWYRGHKGHTLRARELADWMRRRSERFGRVEVRRNVSWGAYKGRTGVVCFHNFWGVGNQGDHIDLWDGTGIIRRELDPSLEGPGMANGSLDYFERAEEVWFWPVH